MYRVKDGASLNWSVASLMSRIMFDKRGPSFVGWKEIDAGRKEGGTSLERKGSGDLRLLSATGGVKL